jgi:uncharacterized protein YmfQ (DUF2313 family)
MDLSAADYRHALQALLPRGPAWSRALEAVLTLLLWALAEEFARVDGRAGTLRRQIDPRTADELLPEWEDLLGLPDTCTGELGTMQQRQEAAYAKLIATGGAGRQYFIDVAATLGYTITITDLVTPHVWQVNAGATTINDFTAGSLAGEQLRTWGNELLECAIEGRKPAHTRVIFAYS